MLTSEYGAINIETGEYSLADYAIKSYNYKCPCCNQRLKLRKGDHNRHHFAHYPQEIECNYYDVSLSQKYKHIHEGQLHITAKHTLKKILESDKEIVILRRCATGQCDNKTVIKLEEPSRDTLFVIEHQMQFDNRTIRPDLVKIENFEVKEIYEIYDTSQTKEINRPNIDWYEFRAEEIISIYNDNNYKRSQRIILYCKRHIIKCDTCVKTEELLLLDKRKEEKESREKKEKYEKNLARIELKLEYNPSNEFLNSLKSQLIKKGVLSDKQLKCLYK